MSDIVYLTEEGLNKLKAEINQLKFVERPKVAKQISEAREKGDLSENAEYDAAKEAQSHLELKISKLEDVLMKARVLNPADIDTSKVSIFTEVEIKNVKLNKVMKYRLVSENEANLKEAKISVTSPVGKGLLGKKVGDIAEIHTPGGIVQFEILSITI
ncbi:MAG: transcription elongation factor GreA [Chitinophagaceae bacterium]|nr:MAG: transcription elongation factor GreA [Chitinophagaceae bacterium]